MQVVTFIFVLDTVTLLYADNFKASVPFTLNFMKSASVKVENVVPNVVGEYIKHRPLHTCSFLGKSGLSISKFHVPGTHRLGTVPDVGIIYPTTIIYSLQFALLNGDKSNSSTLFFQ